jgi:hypothetical protein
MWPAVIEGLRYELRSFAFERTKKLHGRPPDIES